MKNTSDDNNKFLPGYYLLVGFCVFIILYQSYTSFFLNIEYDSSSSVYLVNAKIGLQELIGEIPIVGTPSLPWYSTIIGVLFYLILLTLLRWSLRKGNISHRVKSIVLNCIILFLELLIWYVLSEVIIGHISSMSPIHPIYEMSKYVWLLKVGMIQIVLLGAIAESLTPKLYNALYPSLLGNNEELIDDETAIA